MSAAFLYNISNMDYLNNDLLEFIGQKIKAVQSFNNQNNAGNNQYENPNKTLTEASNVLNTTAPVNGSFSTSNMEQQKLKRNSGNYNSVTGNANPTGENGINTNISSVDTEIEIPNFEAAKNIVPSTSTTIETPELSEGVVTSIKNKLFELGKTYKSVEMQEQQPENPQEEQLIPEKPNESLLAKEEEREVNRFFEPDPLLEAMEEAQEQKSFNIKKLLKSLNSLSEEVGLFHDIKNARKYAKIFNTKLASLGEHAEITKPTLHDIKKFGKKVSVRVNIKKY